jgi:hypothetical protein
MGDMPTVTDGTHVTRRGDGVEVGVWGGGGGVAAGATIGVFAATLRSGGTTLGSGALGGGSVGIGGTIGRCAEAGGGSVAGIVR